MTKRREVRAFCVTEESCYGFGPNEEEEFAVQPGWLRAFHGYNEPIAAARERSTIIQGVGRIKLESCQGDLWANVGDWIVMLDETTLIVLSHEAFRDMVEGI